jgi:heme oxygenase
MSAEVMSMALPEKPSLLHHQLRQATKIPHHALDHHPVLQPLLKPSISVAQYGNALAALHGIYVQAEAGIFSFLEQHAGLFDYHSRYKLPALASDLALLGRIPVPCSTAVAAPKTMGALIGILYTLEGSTQGGQFIVRHLRQVFDETVPVQFFNGYGDFSRQRWREFLHFADAHCPVSEYETAAASAVTLFEAIKSQLDAAHRRFENG